MTGRDEAPRTLPDGILAQPLWVAVAMLLWALLTFNPYGYYILLRWVVCAYCLWLGVAAWPTVFRSWAPTIWVSALLYNPIAPVSFSRDTWSILNVATVGLLVAFRFNAQRRNRSEAPPHPHP